MSLFQIIATKVRVRLTVFRLKEVVQSISALGQVM